MRCVPLPLSMYFGPMSPALEAGVPDEQKELIFEPFERAGDRHPGVGLGLAVARGFAEAMGGRIGAFDTPGGGLTVRVTLPAASEDRSELDSARPSRSPGS